MIYSILLSTIKFALIVNGLRLYFISVNPESDSQTKLSYLVFATPPSPLVLPGFNFWNSKHVLTWEKSEAWFTGSNQQYYLFEFLYRSIV